MDRSCKVFYSTTPKVNVDGCIFDNCGIETICINCLSSVGDFSFNNNNVQNVKEQFMLINNLKTGVTFKSNQFHDISIEGGYFISINHDQEEIEIFNTTFSKISSGDGLVYGGGLSLWFSREERKVYKLQFTDCKFYDITNNNSKHPYNQGGSIQYGYSTSISNVYMTFQSCEFLRNQCSKPSSRGGAIGLNINHDLVISDCKFESNEAKTYGGCIYVSGEIIDSIAGEAKACEMESIRIIISQFISNNAAVGSAFYTYSDKISHVNAYIISCAFIDNGVKDLSYPLSSDCNNVDIFNTTMPYTTMSNKGIFALNQIKNANLTNCTFANSYVADGSFKFNGQNDQSYTSINKCRFINCAADGFTITLAGIVEIDSSDFLFDNEELSCGAIRFISKGFTLRDSTFTNIKSSGAILFEQKSGDNDAVIFSGCTFDNCKENTTDRAYRCFQITINTDSFTFYNNTIKNMVKSHLDKEHGGYFGKFDCTTKKDMLVLDEITFLDNTCDSIFGGGIGLWIIHFEYIKFNKCKFINNQAHKSVSKRPHTPLGEGEGDYYSGDGGAIQFGFTDMLYDANMIFTDCIFKDNKAVRHGGAIALQTVGTVDIIRCKFESNRADYQEQSSSKLLQYENHYSKKKEGRGGAIYINPAFSHIYKEDLSHMISINIKDCTFINNYAFDGQAVYIEGENPGTNFSIKDNSFKDNYDKNDPSSDKSIISSEIKDIFDKDSFLSNNFQYTDPNVIIPPIIYVDFNGSPVSQPPIFTREPEDIDELEIVNATSSGRQEFIITDDSRVLIYIMISKFINITSEKDGGAIHIKNAGLICNNILFKNCSSLKGGAIYYSNVYNNSNVVTLIGNEVTLCEAQYGGGFYITQITGIIELL